MIRASSAAAAVAIAVALGAGPAAADAPADAATLAVAPSVGPAMMARLAGQRAHLAGERLVIDDIAGDGRPWIGVVERRGDQLWLRGAAFAVRLTGPLARPRLAGPGYTIWVVGTRTGERLAARRLGVLAPPP